MTTQQIIEKAREERLRQDAREEEEAKPLDAWDANYALESMMKAYCTGRSPHNYLRITRIKPPNFEEMPFFFICKLQAWTKDGLAREERIINDAFYNISKLEGWVDRSDNVIEKYVYRHPKFRET